jgi:hypothetical protein
MCLNCACRASIVEPLRLHPAQCRPQKNCNRSSSTVLRPARLDPVRAMRVRVMLERTVLTGLGPQLFPKLPRGCTLLPRSSSTRGGARQAFARQVAIYLGHVGCSLSYAHIGWLYGRDRTTAAHACAVVEDRREDVAFDRVMGLMELCIKAEFARIEPKLTQPS